MRTVGPTEDRFLLTALAAGDTSALQVLYEKYSAPVLHLLLLHTASREDAEDLMQEAFLALVERGRGVTKIRNARAYLLKVALNKAGRLYGKNRPMEMQLDEHSLVDHDAVPSEQRLDTLRVQEALAQLPLQQCEAIILKVWHEYTFAEMAEVFDIPINTAASRYRYGLEKLQRILGDTNGRA